MKRSVIILFLLLPGLLLAQAAAKVQQTKIHGTWKADLEGDEITLVLNADGTGNLDGDKIRYTVGGSKINVTILAESQTLIYDYAWEGNSLVVSGGDLEEKITLTRFGSATENYESSSTLNNSIIGVWSDSHETIEFTKTGQCLFLNRTFNYQVTGNTITIQTHEGAVIFSYTVSGDKLTLTTNGQTSHYTKTGISLGTGSLHPDKTVAQELVGKWCYINVGNYTSGGSSSEQCITLKRDGTYEYYSESSRSVNTNAYSGGTNSQSSDHGTWSYDGTRIHYISAAGNGSGSYLLEKRNHPKNNDPMIVLDGQAYVTQYQKAPWR